MAARCTLQAVRCKLYAASCTLTALVCGWQAPTTDVPVSQVPALREWFDEALRTTLFPMLAQRYPHVTGGAANLRVMDAFVVRYDAGAQAHTEFSSSFILYTLYLSLYTLHFILHTSLIRLDLAWV